MSKLRNATQPREHEQIDLLRGGSIVSSFVGSFGGNLRETRLTAVLGYLMALAPGDFYEASSRLPEALYFAPHFGQAIAKQHPGIRVGVSYLAKIESVEVVESFNELIEVVSQVRGKQWQSRQEHLLQAPKEWDWSKRHSFLFLGEPRLVFNPPVKKEKLQKGKGWLSKRVFSFDKLFEAWGC